jgi:signal transduction histidine kinase
MTRLRSNAVAQAAENDAPAIDDASVDGLRERVATLEEEKQKLQQLVEYRSTFLSRLAHELRTPLTSILGFSEILISQERLTETQRGFCERIQSSAQQLQLTLNQLADLARLESGRSRLQREEFSLGDLLRESCAALTRQARKQDVRLSYEAPSELPPIVSDRIKLGQVLYNFIAYAIARSPEAAEVAIAGKEEARGFHIRIEDEGEVIADRAPFEMDLARGRAGCSELGLAIARQNMDLLGASLTIQNRPSRGLQISIFLPAVAPDTPTR